MSELNITSTYITSDKLIYGHGIDDDDTAFFVQIGTDDIDGITRLVKIDSRSCNLVNINTDKNLGRINFVPDTGYSKTMFIPIDKNFTAEIIGKWHYDTEEKLLKFLCQNKPSSDFISFLEKGY